MFEPTLETYEMGNETVKETQRNVIPNTREPCSSIYMGIETYMCNHRNICVEAQIISEI